MAEMKVLKLGGLTLNYYLQNLSLKHLFLKNYEITSNFWRRSVFPGDLSAQSPSKFSKNSFSGLGSYLSECFRVRGHRAI